MGSFTSGSTDETSRRASTDEAVALDLKDFRKELFDPEGTWPIRLRLRSGNDVVLGIRLSGEHKGRAVDISWRAGSAVVMLDADQVKGGDRHWWICPTCDTCDLESKGQRRRILYLHQGRLGCRVCLDLSYRSTRRPKPERQTVAAHQRRVEISKRMGRPDHVDVEIWGRVQERYITEGKFLVGRPKGQHKRTWVRLWMEYVEATHEQHAAHVLWMEAGIDGVTDE